MSLTLLALLVAAQGAAPVCSATPPPAAQVVAGQTFSQMAALTLGQPTGVALGDTGKVTYLAMPEHAPPPGSKGGLLKFVATVVGTYRIALGTGAWIDVLDAAAKPVVSVAHMHGAACSGVRKIVDFRLAPGTYAVQLSGSGDATTSVTVSRLP